ncbi:MAG: trehalose-binding protein [Desulfovibrionaceae bacterium]|nr:trehalose-binding protein [Desulfovibrionaceae bacterium]
MDIGSYSFAEFRQLAANFHGYAAPGLLIGGYMVELAKRQLPPNTLFEAVVETRKCLPDAVQLLTLCSTGNTRLKICNLGRYALSLFDKYTGEGVRVSIDSVKIHNFPEIAAWFFKLKPKKEQDSQRLEAEIEQAGDAICKIQHICINQRYIGRSHMEQITNCPICGEAYPAEDGPICRGCQGEAPYVLTKPLEPQITQAPPVKVVPVEDAVGHKASHDMTRIVPGQFKGPEFKAGQRISVGDVCRLQQMGRFHVAVVDEEQKETGANALLHENAVAETFAKLMAGPGVSYELPPREGKIDFKASVSGLFSVDVERLYQFNLVPEVMCATRQNGLLVAKDSKLAGTRAIPLYISQERLAQAKKALGDTPLFQVTPLRNAQVGILVTGTEVFQGLIEDKFIPIITAKVTNLGSTVCCQQIVPDDRATISQAILEMRSKGCDLLITTGGLSVDPDDVTRLALQDAGLLDLLYGIPVLPGTMSLIGEIRDSQGTMQVLGVPACALYFKTTALDLLLPRLLANQHLTRKELARLGEGSYCMGCQNCTWPKCWFGK